MNTQHIHHDKELARVVHTSRQHDVKRSPPQDVFHHHDILRHLVGEMDQSERKIFRMINKTTHHVESTAPFRLEAATDLHALAYAMKKFDIWKPFEHEGGLEPFWLRKFKRLDWYRNLFVRHHGRIYSDRPVEVFIPRMSPMKLEGNPNFASDVIRKLYPKSGIDPIVVRVECHRKDEWPGPKGGECTISGPVLHFIACTKGLVVLRFCNWPTPKCTYPLDSSFEMFWDSDYAFSHFLLNLANPDHRDITALQGIRHIHIKQDDRHSTFDLKDLHFLTSLQVLELERVQAVALVLPEQLKRLIMTDSFIRCRLTIPEHVTELTIIGQPCAEGIHFLGSAFEKVTLSDFLMTITWSTMSHVHTLDLGASFTVHKFDLDVSRALQACFDHMTTPALKALTLTYLGQNLHHLIHRYADQLKYLKLVHCWSPIVTHTTSEAQPALQSLHALRAVDVLEIIHLRGDPRNDPMIIYRLDSTMLPSHLGELRIAQLFMKKPMEADLSGCDHLHTLVIRHSDPPAIVTVPFGLKHLTLEDIWMEFELKGLETLWNLETLKLEGDHQTENASMAPTLIPHSPSLRVIVMPLRNKYREVF